MQQLYILFVEYRGDFLSLGLYLYNIGGELLFAPTTFNFINFTINKIITYTKNKIQPFVFNFFYINSSLFLTKIINYEEKCIPFIFITHR